MIPLKRVRGLEISDCICTECGTLFPIPRNRGNRRENGHIKDIWCPHCKKITKFKEHKKNQYMMLADGRIMY